MKPRIDVDLSSSDSVLSKGEIARLASFARASGEQFACASPIAAAPLGHLRHSTLDDVEEAARLARLAAPTWAATPLSARASICRHAHDLLLERQGEILDLVQLETGKSRVHAYEEVADCANLLRHYARMLPRYLSHSPRRGLIPIATQVRVEYRPYGIVGVITPWNYPLSLAFADAVTALLAGNAVLLRPDSQTPLTALWVAELLADAGVPGDVLHVLLGPGRRIGAAVIDHVDYVAFTGSSKTGAGVAQQAAGRLIESTLELGGKNSMYVAADCDPAAAAEGAVRACFASAGQLCLSIERVIVDAAIAPLFVREFRARVRSLTIGIGLDYTADIGSLSSQEQYERVEGFVRDALDNGAELLEGGVGRKDIGPLCFAPTVLGSVPASARLHAEEVFGPVVAVYEVNGDDEAIALMNDTPYGLNAAIWTADVRRARRLAGNLRCGIVNINEGYVAAWGSPAAPVGGVGLSGWGKRHGPEGVRQFCFEQTIAAQRGTQVGLGLGKLYDLENDNWTALMTGALRVMRRLHMK